MKRLIATLGLALVAAVSTFGGAMAQDASPVASPVASPEAASGIPPLVWVSNDFLPTGSMGTPEQGAVALGSEYWVQFLPDGGFSFRADCNGGFGSYELDGSNLTLGPLGTTLMLCPEGGQGSEFVDALSTVTNWSIDQSEASDVLVLTTEDGTDLTFDASITGVVWQWSETQMSNDTVTTPNDPEKYQLSFSEDGSVVGVIDCNHAFGSYTTDGNRITMMLATTRVFCGEDSQDTSYALNLAQVTSFVIRDGQLALAMPMDAGIVIFDPVINP
jgi:heat shock protein HslJ